MKKNRVGTTLSDKRESNLKTIKSLETKKTANHLRSYTDCLSWTCMLCFLFNPGWVTFLHYRSLKIFEFHFRTPKNQLQNPKSGQMQFNIFLFQKSNDCRKWITLTCNRRSYANSRKLLIFWQTSRCFQKSFANANVIRTFNPWPFWGSILFKVFWLTIFPQLKPWRQIT